MSGVLYDTGAVLAAERRHRDLWVLHEQSLASGVRPIVPVVVLAQAWRGKPHANLSRLLRGCQVTPDTEELAGALSRVIGNGNRVKAHPLHRGLAQWFRCVEAKAGPTCQCQIGDLVQFGDRGTVAGLLRHSL